MLSFSWFKKNKVYLKFDKMSFELLIDKLFEKFTKSIVTASTKYFFNFLIIFINENSLINVNFIDVVTFSRLARKRNHVLNAFNLKNIEKIFNIKLKTNSATKLSKKFYHLLNVFFIKKRISFSRIAFTIIKLSY